MHSLFLLCGLLCDETIWADVPARLAEVADVRIASFSGFKSIEAMAENVLGAAPARFALAGHSMGGRIALEAWRQAPQRITGLALLNTAASPVRSAEYENRALLVRLARERGMAELAQHWLPPMMGHAPERTAQLMPLLSAMVQRSSVESFAGQSGALLRRPDARLVLPTIAVPTLLLSGVDDGWSSVAQHAAMQRSVPHATLVEVAGAGHMAPFERPDAVGRALRNWLSAIASAHRS